ncbi:MAG: hypothetical protein HYT79_02315 [Elusimicrobia bacterium]|nr:hypothetical protein [Elusimicrobiota bacterium]
MRILILIVLFALGVSPLSAQEKKFMPYYRFNFGEGMALPSKGDFFASQDLSSQVGALVKPLGWLHFFGMYDLTYEGPGLMRSEGRIFSERAMRHSFMLEPTFATPYGKIRTRGFIINEKRRSGTNEVWGKGLYDYEAQGASVGFEKEVFGLKVFPAITITKMEFPNFTDLLREFQSASLTSELSGGLMDQDVQALSLDVSRQPFNAHASISTQKYKREKVVASNGTYSGENQKDTVSELGANFETTLWRFSFVPKAVYRMKRSNQNYLRFAFFGDTNPTFIAKNYDYNEFGVGGRLYLKLTQTKAIFGSIDLNNRSYTDRPTRNESGVYQSEKQKTIWGSWGGGLQWKVAEYSTWNLAYNFVHSSSNMKFERFIPYNYTGHVVGLYFTVAP